MYSYNYNYSNPQQFSQYKIIPTNNQDDRFVGGIIAPLLLGGVAGYAIGQNNNNYNRPYMFYTQPYPYYYPYYTPYYYGR